MVNSEVLMRHPRGGGRVAGCMQGSEAEDLLWEYSHQPRGDKVMEVDENFSGRKCGVKRAPRKSL